MKFYDYLIEKAKKDGIQKFVVGGVITNSLNQVLILTRKTDDFMGGIKELPSGNLESEETIYNGLKREIKEETNLDLKNVKSYINSFDYLSSSGKKARQFNFLVYVNNNFDIKLTEHDKYDWISFDEISSQKEITDEVKNTLQIAHFNHFINWN